MQIFRYGLGDEVKDIVTGFKGIIMNRTEWFNGCIRYGLQSTAKLKAGEGPKDNEAFDEQQLELIKAKKVIVNKKQTKTGGPMGDVSGLPDIK